MYLLKLIISCLLYLDTRKEPSLTVDILYFEVFVSSNKSLVRCEHKEQVTRTNVYMMIINC